MSYIVFLQNYFISIIILGGGPKLTSSPWPWQPDGNHPITSGHFRKYLAGDESSQEAKSACFAVLGLYSGQRESRRARKQITFLLRMDNDGLEQTQDWKNTKEAIGNFRRLLLCSKWWVYVKAAVFRRERPLLSRVPANDTLHYTTSTTLLMLHVCWYILTGFILNRQTMPQVTLCTAKGSSKTLNFSTARNCSNWTG